MPDSPAIDRVAPVGSMTQSLPQKTSHVVDAALDELGAQGDWDGRLAQQRLGLWGELTQTEHPGTTRAMVAVLASAALAGTVRARGASWFPRRRSTWVALG
jgi:hypothetical protein